MFNLSTGGAILGDRKSCCLEEILDVEMVIFSNGVTLEYWSVSCGYSDDVLVPGSVKSGTYIRDRR